jgi:hypothetical protein
LQDSNVSKSRDTSNKGTQATVRTPGTEVTTTATGTPVSVISLVTAKNLVTTRAPVGQSATVSATGGRSAAVCMPATKE